MWGSLQWSRHKGSFFELNCQGDSMINDRNEPARWLLIQHCSGNGLCSYKICHNDNLIDNEKWQTMRTNERSYRWYSDDTVMHRYRFAPVYESPCGSIINDENKLEGWALTQWCSGTESCWDTKRCCNSILKDEKKPEKIHCKGTRWYFEARIADYPSILGGNLRLDGDGPGVGGLLLWSTSVEPCFDLKFRCRFCKFNPGVGAVLQYEVSVG